jgi:hypothetical protein
VVWRSFGSSPSKEQIGQLSRFADHFEHYCDLAQLTASRNDKTLIDVFMFIARSHFKGFYKWMVERTMNSTVGQQSVVADTWAAFRAEMEVFEHHPVSVRDEWTRRFDPQQPFITENALLKAVLDRPEGKTFWIGQESGERSTRSRNGNSGRKGNSGGNAKEEQPKGIKVRPLFVTKETKKE